MRKSGKEMKTEKTEALVSPSQGGKEETSGEKKPRRGRKPKAGKPQEEAGAAAETEAVQEADTTAKPETAQETVGETATETVTTAEQEPAQEAAEMPAAETEPAVQESADKDQDGTPPETAPEAGTEPQNDTAEEPAAEGESAQEGATGEEDGTEESGEEPEPEQEEKVPVPVPAPTASAQIVESPLKQMKQEFQRRSQVIRNEMRNIQNSFVTIGFQLHWIHRNNMFRVLNYKSIYEYAEKECNIKRTTCCNLICIIENYADRDENGEVIESIADCYRNYSASQLVAMLGMPEDLKGQVSPDMSVRAINRLKKGETDTVEPSPAPVEEPAPVKEPVTEKDAENPAAEEEAVPDDTVREEAQESTEAQEPEGPAAENPETAEDDTAREEEPEDTDAMETETYGDDAEEHTETANSEGATLAEIDSYTDYQSMQDELDLIMKSVFSADAPVRVKIVCVQG